MTYEATPSIGKWEGGQEEANSHRAEDKMACVNRFQVTINLVGPSFQHYPEGTILQNGLSKWASAGGWRLGYHIYPPNLSDLRDVIRSSASQTYSCASAPIQFGALEYFK